MWLPYEWTVDTIYEAGAGFYVLQRMDCIFHAPVKFKVSWETLFWHYWWILSVYACNLRRIRDIWDFDYQTAPQDDEDGDTGVLFCVWECEEPEYDVRSKPLHCHNVFYQDLCPSYSGNRGDCSCILYCFPVLRSTCLCICQSSELQRRERFDDIGGDAVGIKIHIDVMMARRKIGLTELAGKIDITPANLSILKNNKAKAVRFSTLEAICRGSIQLLLSAWV